MPTQPKPINRSPKGNIPQRVLQQLADEPAEILRSASSQVAPEIMTPNESYSSNPNTPKQNIDEQKQIDANRTRRRMEALENELGEIRQKKKLDEEEKKKLEEEQKLQQAQQVSAKNEVPQISTRKPKGLFGPAANKLKQHVEGLTKRVESPRPPSG